MEIIELNDVLLIVEYNCKIKEFSDFLFWIWVLLLRFILKLLDVIKFCSFIGKIFLLFFVIEENVCLRKELIFLV